MVSESASPVPLESEVETPEISMPQPAAEWSLLKKILFRFSFVYLVLYCFPFPLIVLPYAEVLVKPWQTFVTALVSSVGWMAFRIDAENHPSGSGDTMFDWMQAFTWLMVAALVTVLWTWLGRKRTGHVRLEAWLRSYVRFFLCIFMLSYGASKAIKSQFAFPGLDELLQPLGESSPMGMVWDFMGASTAYTMFTGLVEMLGGFLLAFRRTALLGALVSIGAMLNVLMLNLCYDVPVKLFSGHLMLIGVFLALPHLRRLLDLFVLNRRVERFEERRLFESPRRNLAMAVASVVLVLAFAGWSLYGSWQASVEWGDLRPHPPLYGIWTAEEVVVDGVSRPPLVTDGARWRYLIFDYPDFASLRLMDPTAENGQQAYRIKVDEAKGRITFTKWKDVKWRSVFTYRKPAPDVLEIQGAMDGKTYRARLRRMDERRFMLVSRGFHWVSEYPMNH